jgi:hypothetical protein
MLGKEVTFSLLSAWIPMCAFCLARMSRHEIKNIFCELKGINEICHGIMQKPLR